MSTPARTNDFDAAMRSLGLGAESECWRDGWRESQASMPPRGPAFLRPGFVRETCGALGLADDVREAIVASLGAFRRQEALALLAWHAHRRLFARERSETIDPVGAKLGWPRDLGALGGGAGMLYPVVLLSGAASLRALHRRRGVDEAITRDTAGDLELWMRHYRARTGRWGLAQMHWLVNHFLGRLVKLGRLQFHLERFAYDVRAFRSRRDGRVVLLAPPGARFRRDGQFDGTGGVHDDRAWTAELVETGGTIRAQAVSPQGRALPEPVVLPAEEWTCILRRGDAVLGVHIPATGPMSHEACGESFRKAAAFFPEHFPEFPFHAFVCTSWFLDEQFGRLLGASSNIRRFQEEVYLFPLPGASDDQTFERVFGHRPADLAGAPRDTALRRVIIDHVLAGGHFHAGGMVLFPEDLDWGRRVYHGKD